MLCLTAVKLNILGPEDLPLTPRQPFGIIYSLATFEASDFKLTDTKKTVCLTWKNKVLFFILFLGATLNLSDNSAKKYRVFIIFLKSWRGIIYKVLALHLLLISQSSCLDVSMFLMFSETN